MYLNLTVAFLTFLGFCLAVRTTNKEGNLAKHRDEAAPRPPKLSNAVFMDDEEGYFSERSEIHSLWSED